MLKLSALQPHLTAAEALNQQAAWAKGSRYDSNLLFYSIDLFRMNNAAALFWMWCKAVLAVLGQLKKVHSPCETQANMLERTIGMLRDRT